MLRQNNNSIWVSAGTQMCKKTRCQGGNKVKKLFAVLLTVCLMLGMFSACSNGKDTVDDPANTGAENGLSVSKEPIKDLVTYVVASQEMSTFNILYSQSTNETQVLTNCIDGLLSHDNYGNLVPALAESWESDDGGLTWTFHLRKGVQWVDYQAQPQTDVVADDWLWGLEWVLNFYKNGAYNTSMPKKMIAGAEDYYNYTAGYYGLDLTPYLARTNYINPQNCANYAYTMSNLVSFSDGTEYTQRVMDKLGIKADGTSFARYDAAKADEYKSKAIEELTAKGVTFPVEIDYYIKASDQTALDNANVMKQMFSDCLGDDFVTFNIKTYVSSVAKEVRNPQLASFYVNAWGADYGDPQNFLGQETYGDDNAWYSTAYSKANNITDPELLAVYQKFTAMVEKASNTTDDMDARYEAYADAEAYMLDKVITLPLYKVVSWEMTHVNDYSKIYAPYGIQINKFKNWETSVDLYTTEDYAKLAAIYEANAAK